MADKIPFISDEKLARIAEKVRELSGANDCLPVDIERIVEFSFGLSIVPIQGLEEKFGIQNYLTADFQKIIIDEAQFLRYPTRVRFTLAHELGHFLLHKKILNKANIDSVDQLLAFHQQFSDKEYSWIEIQANYFASHLLFPFTSFSQLVEESITNAGGMDSYSLIHYEDLLKKLMTTFDVSRSCAETKLKRTYPELQEKSTTLVMPDDVKAFFASLPTPQIIEDDWPF